mmetsp:Transcript_25202/g.40772  ORF Transcript_25202/g.40772 Transcript_25202/m.40772 type:complete len:128 (+) Transcript_25202:2654-3037(+)
MLLASSSLLDHALEQAHTNCQAYQVWNSFLAVLQQRRQVRPTLCKQSPTWPAPDAVRSNHLCCNHRESVNLLIGYSNLGAYSTPVTTRFLSDTFRVRSVCFKTKCWGSLWLRFMRFHPLTSSMDFIV